MSVRPTSAFLRMLPAVVFGCTGCEMIPEFPFYLRSSAFIGLQSTANIRFRACQPI
jgi:hypothetical protein